MKTITPYLSYYTIETFGRIYRSNGATHGSHGSIGGIPAHHVRNHCRKAKMAGGSYQVTSENTGRIIPPGQIWGMDVFREDS